jgi:hypothetical protein
MDKDSDINKNYFDPKEYSSLIIGAEEKKASAKSKANLIALLTDAHERDVRDDVLKLIKKEPHALGFLIDAIEDKKLDKYKANLISACWESGIDCRSKLAYFVDLATRSSYLCCIEAFSVVDGIELPVDQNELDKSILLLNKYMIGQDPLNDKSKLLKQLGGVLESLKE